MRAEAPPSSPFASSRAPALPPGRPRWQEEGLSLSFRACRLTNLSALAEALAQVGAGARAVLPPDVSHLDLAENELIEPEDLLHFSKLLSLDLSHNSLPELPRLPTSLLHLNLSYNHLESAERLGALTSLVELNLGYNLLTSVAPLERLANLQVLLLPANRISALHGLAALSRLSLLDLKHNYIDKVAEVRLLSLNPELKTLSLQGNPVTKLVTYRSSTIATLPGLLTLDGQRTPPSPAQRNRKSAAKGAAEHPATAPLKLHTRYADAAAPAAPPALTLVAASPQPLTPARRAVQVAAQERGCATASRSSLDAALRRSSSSVACRFIPGGAACKPAPPSTLSASSGTIQYPPTPAGSAQTAGSSATPRRYCESEASDGASHDPMESLAAAMASKEASLKLKASLFAARQRQRIIESLSPADSPYFHEYRPHRRLVEPPMAASAGACSAQRRACGARASGFALRKAYDESLRHGFPSPRPATPLTASTKRPGARPSPRAARGVLA
ncbi:hypothetical protein AB1Y20_014782 [Prymnesium parvum]|uniref:Leucine-rich repeat-containing protein 51 n=1 Tax=Prymnesium parvum TaxID=97485 RepID=A0AB34IBX0_PRYPA